jgi:DNA-binding transcriptional regulator YiaG
VRAIVPAVLPLLRINLDVAPPHPAQRKKYFVRIKAHRVGYTRRRVLHAYACGFHTVPRVCRSTATIFVATNAARWYPAGVDTDLRVWTPAQHTEHMADADTKTADGLQQRIARFRGQRARQRREGIGMSRSHAAQKLGISYETLRKFEAGEIEFSTTRLTDLSRLLRVGGIPWFYEGAPDA